MSPNVLTASRAYVGLGSNIADPKRQLATAIAEMAALPDTRVAAVSSLYRTAPIGGKARQPDYLNAVAAVDTLLPPRELLRSLQAIERGHRRRRTLVNGPRSLDLDLLLYGARQRVGRELQLPHPRLHQRAFLLLPLLEIAPEADIPGRGRARRYLLHSRAQRVARIDASPESINAPHRRSPVP